MKYYKSFKVLFLTLLFFLSGCVKAPSIIKYQIGRSVNGVYGSDQDSYVYLRGLEPRPIWEGNLDSPGYYDVIFYGKVLAIGDLQSGSLQVRGLNPFYIDESGSIHQETTMDVFRGQQQTIEYCMDYRTVTIEVIECVKGDLQPGEQIQVAETWLDQYLHYFFPQENDSAVSTRMLRQVGSEEVFCIDSERIRNKDVYLGTRKVFSWKLDGLPILEGGALNGERLMVEDDMVLIDWQVPEGRTYQPMQRIPTDEFLNSLRERIAAREAELHEYLQIPLPAPEVSYVLEKKEDENEATSSMPYVLVFQCSIDTEQRVDYYIERMTDDGTFEDVYWDNRTMDYFVELGKTYTYRIYTVGTEFWALSELPMSEPTYLTITIPEE